MIKAFRIFDSGFIFIFLTILLGFAYQRAHHLLPTPDLVGGGNDGYCRLPVIALSMTCDQNLASEI